MLSNGECWQCLFFEVRNLGEMATKSSDCVGNMAIVGKHRQQLVMTLQNQTKLLWLLLAN